MGEPGLFLAFDAGGTAVKAALYDSQGAELAIAGRVMDPLRPHPGWAERDMEEMWRVFCALTGEILARTKLDPRRLTCVGLTGFGNGVVLLDGDGRPARAGILSSDQRAGDIVARWRAQGKNPEHLAITHQNIWAAKPLPLLKWVEENEPDAFARVRYVQSCKDYMRYRLTGALRMEVGDCSSGGVIDNQTRQFSEPLLALLDAAHYRPLLPETIEPLEIAGEVTAAAAAETGLAAGTPVSAGFSDGPSMMLAGGVTGPSRMSVVAGTWGLNQLASATPRTDGSILATMTGARPGEYVLVDGAASSASTFEWLLQNIIAPIHPDLERAVLYDWCNAEAARSDTRDAPVFFLPHLNGRIDVEPNAWRGGAFAGLQSWHRVGHLLRGAMEGVAFEHAWHIARLCDGRRPVPQSARFAGGAARSDLWLDIFAAVLDMPIELGPAQEVGALGAAIIAAVGCGHYPDLDAAINAMTKVSRRVDPDPEQTAAMADKKARYNELRAAWR